MIARLPGQGGEGAGRPGVRLRAWIAGAVLTGLIAACAQAPARGPVPTATEPASATQTPHAPEIRFALVGKVNSTNVWSLFDAPGYSYNDYAIRSGYWPRLYDLSVPDGEFKAQAASGDPSPIRQEGSQYTATVALRSDLRWTDGSPLTAEDVAFTVNTALAFQLGFDWADYYNSAWLDHAEAADIHTVKFFFKQMPNVGAWQYGALQGPVVQHKFWATTVAGASALLPAAELSAQIATLKSTIASLETQLGLLNYNAITSQGEEARQVQSGLKRQQGDLDQAVNDLTKAQEEYDGALTAARSALYGLSDEGEPLLGSWSPVQDASGPSQTYQNEVNPTFPDFHPHFDRVVYKMYATDEEAEAALQAGQVDLVLRATGSSASAPPATDGASSRSMKSPTRSMRFLTYNTQSGPWTSRPLRQALACMLNQQDLVGSLGGEAIALSSFVAPQEASWFNPGAALPCQGMAPAERLTQAVQILKTAGFTWTQEPSSESDGAGLARPDGKSVPAMDLLIPSADALRTKTGEYVQQQARLLGIPLTATPVSADALDYAVFSTHDYDMALLGWKVSLYPGYLCDWFGAGKPFAYQGGGVVAACGQLDATSDLGQAAEQVQQIQSSLAQDVPFVPLYSEATYDSYARVAYPFPEVRGGLSGVYGAPNLAFPTAP